MSRGSVRSDWPGVRPALRWVESTLPRAVLIGPSRCVPGIDLYADVQGAPPRVRTKGVRCARPLPCAGLRQNRGGTSRRPATPVATPTRIPATTSEKKCAPRWRREYATVSASTPTAAPRAGLSIATPAARAAPVALWPEGKAGDRGVRAVQRRCRMPCARGRRARIAFFATRLANPLAAPRVIRPRTAAARPRAPVRARAAVTASQKGVLPAALDTASRVASTGSGVRSAERARPMCRSARRMSRGRTRRRGRCPKSMKSS